MSVEARLGAQTNTNMQIATSPDGQWAAVRRGRELTLLAGGAGPAIARIELETDDADLWIVGPPSVLVVVTRGTAASGESLNRLTLYQPPYLDAVARLDLEAEMRITAVTGPRMALVSRDGKEVTIVRIAGRALSSQSIETGSPVEFAVGLERNQILFGLLRKLEAWDAVSGRPLLRMQLQLPPPPRLVGPAHGHVWAIRPSGEDIIVCRLSDGRPFRHHIGAPIDDVICHPSSPLLIVTTVRGLVRVHCFAHSLTVIDAPWQPGVPLAQLVVGEDISLLGLPDDAEEPWRVPIGGAGAPAISLESIDAPMAPAISAADKLRAMRERSLPALSGDGSGPVAMPPTPPITMPPPAISAPPPATAPLLAISAPPPSGPAAAVFRPSARTAPDATRAKWREPLAAFGAELVRGGDGELPVVATDTELGQLAQRLGLPSAARRALIALYSAHLVGERGLAIARLAQATGDWTEPLGQGELQALGLLRRRGAISLRTAVTDLLDGAPPRAIRWVGAGPATLARGALRVARDGRTDPALEAELAEQFGRVAVIDGSVATGLLEARLHAATAVALRAPLAPPAPRDASIVFVDEPGGPAWVAALPDV